MLSIPYAFLEFSMKTLLRLFLFFLLVTGIGFAGWKYYQDDIIPVELIKVEKGSIESIIRVTGKVINDRTVALTALVDGQIQGMLVQKGEKVKAGQVLAYLDKREASAQLEKTNAVVAREQQTVKETARKLDRLKKISLTGNASDQSVEDAESLWQAAKARLQVALSEQRIAHIHQEKVEVTAPWDGVIIEKTAEQGQWVEAGIKLYSLVAEKGYEIEANVDAGDSGVVKIGQPVTLSCDAFPGIQWTETIHWISPAIVTDKESVLNSFAVRTTLSNDAPSLLLGQQVDVNIRTAFRNEALILPYNALIESLEETKIAIVENGKVKYLPVKTGIEDFTHVEIIEGVSETTTAILTSGKSLKENTLVNVMADKITQ